MFLTDAIELAVKNVKNNGGPFGAIIVRDGEIIAEASNQVLQKNDPTAHAEVEAIRKAALKTGHYDLSGCTLYSSCEPCPMCLGAIYWAGIETVYFASTRYDAAKAGFSDAMIYEELEKPIEFRQLPTIRLQTDNAGTEFLTWEQNDERILY